MWLNNQEAADAESFLTNPAQLHKPIAHLSTFILLYAKVILVSDSLSAFLDNSIQEIWDFLWLPSNTLLSLCVREKEREK